MYPRIILSILLLTILSGCKLDLPLVDAGSVEFHSDGRVTKTALSDFQINALSTWLHAHKDGWKYRIEDTGPRLLVYLKQGAKTVAVVNIGEREIQIKDLFRAITSDEHAMLHSILEPTKG